jgi:hypothetical protein
MVISANFAAAQTRYFYYTDSTAYYCQPPVTYVQGCYIVHDNPGVVAINSYPTITPARCEEIIQSCGSTVHCGPTGGHHCYPSLLHRCHCHVPGTPIPITGTPGRLKTTCESEKFYRGIEPRDATIPVPEICVNARERYDFRHITLDYDCKQADCPELNCDFSKCYNDCCKVRTCEVYQCVIDCHMECKLVKRTGPVLIAVRARQVAGQFVADVVIGRDGKAAFGAYPENTVILQAATRSEIKNRLGLDVDLGTISGTTDLKSLIN